MRGENKKQSSMLMLMSPESRVPATHPIRRIKTLSDDALAKLSSVFDTMYASTGRPSIPPERLLKATLLMALYSVRSERQFCEQLDYNLLFRWFLDMDMTEASFDATAFTHNRARLIAHDVAGAFFRAVVDQAKSADLMSSDHFTVDGTLIEAAASLKSFKRKDDDDTKPPDDKGNPTVDFHGEKRSNATHESTTDPDAKLARKGKGKEAKLSYSAHALMENRNGLLVGFELDTADGYAERRAALDLVDRCLPGKRRITLGADKGYHTRAFIRHLRARGIRPHVAPITGKRTPGLDRRTTRHRTFAVSQRCRQRVEEVFGWAKTTGGLRKTRFRGVARTELYALLVGTPYNLVRMSRLAGAPG